MSLVTASSDGQNPAHFTNYYRTGITLKKDSEVALVGYTMRLDAPSKGLFEINSTCNTFIIYLGSSGVATTGGHTPIATCTIKEGYYTDVQLQDAIEEAAEDEFDRVGYGAYVLGCVSGAGPGPFTITCGQARTQLITTPPTPAPLPAQQMLWNCNTGDILLGAGPTAGFPSTLLTNVPTAVGTPTTPGKHTCISTLPLLSYVRLPAVVVIQGAMWEFIVPAGTAPAQLAGMRGGLTSDMFINYGSTKNAKIGEANYNINTRFDPAGWTQAANALYPQLLQLAGVHPAQQGGGGWYNHYGWCWHVGAAATTMELYITRGFTRDGIGNGIAQVGPKGYSDEVATGVTLDCAAGANLYVELTLVETGTPGFEFRLRTTAAPAVAATAAPAATRHTLTDAQGNNYCGEVGNFYAITQFDNAVTLPIAQYTISQPAIPLTTGDPQSGITFIWNNCPLLQATAAGLSTTYAEQLTWNLSRSCNAGAKIGFPDYAQFTATPFTAGIVGGAFTGLDIEQNCDAYIVCPNLNLDGRLGSNGDTSQLLGRVWLAPIQKEKSTATAGSPEYWGPIYYDYPELNWVSCNNVGLINMNELEFKVINKYGQIVGRLLPDTELVLKFRPKNYMGLPT
jgi:hypothetical protein